MYEGRKRFHIKVGNSNVGVIQFEEVIGLEFKDELGQGSESDGYAYNPGVRKDDQGYTSIIFRGGDIQGDRFLLDFFMGRGIDKLHPRQITLTLLDKRSNPIQRWTFEDAFPQGIQIINQRTDSYSIYIDSVSIAYKKVELEVLD